MEQTDEFGERLESMEKEDCNYLYRNYTDWTRHLRNQILTISTLGITLSLGNLSISTILNSTFLLFSLSAVFSMKTLAINYSK